MNELYKYEIVTIDSLKEYENNSRTHTQLQITQVMNSIKEFGFTNPLLVDEKNIIRAGHCRLMAAIKLGMTELPIIRLAGLSPSQMTAIVIADNQLALNADWDLSVLGIEIEQLQNAEFNIDLLGFNDDFLNELFNDEESENNDPYADGVIGSMAANFGVPPFSVLDTRRSEWLERKRLWRELIGDNGESREETLGIKLGKNNMATASLLDPVMSELIVKWFGFENGLAFDPFAGDSVFGFVAGSCGMGFKGIELRKEQADLNQLRCDKANLPCKYFCDTSENMDKYIEKNSVDLIFSCPPYADLEVYSDDPNDLSNMSHDNFFDIYSKILSNTFNKLKQNRFAVIVMGEVRGKNGDYIGTIPKTISLMENAGYQYYNEIILVNGAGTLPLRAGKSMRASRKVGKHHQNILVFLKGNAKLAAKELGDISSRLDFEVEDE